MIVAGCKNSKLVDAPPEDKPRVYQDMTDDLNGGAKELVLNAKAGTVASDFASPDKVPVEVWQVEAVELDKPHAPNQDSVTLRAIHLGSIRAKADGSFSASVRLPRTPAGQVASLVPS